MLWRLSLVVAVLCAGAMCSCVRADLMSRLIVPRDYGVKLCGREFIRAVIFTCGGSRWRRSTDGDSDLFQWISPSDVTAQNNQQSDSDPTDNLTPPHTSSSSQSLSDLLALYTVIGDQQQPPPPPPPPPPPHHHQQQQPPLLSDPFLLDTSQPALVLGGQDGSSAAAAAGWSKKKRNFSLGVAGMCCSQGCTKNDIGRLC